MAGRCRPRAPGSRDRRGRIATTEREFGILHTEGRVVTAYESKPRLRYRVDMGVYAGRVGSYAHHGYWLDLGRRDDFERAQRAA